MSDWLAGVNGGRGRAGYKEKPIEGFAARQAVCRILLLSRIFPGCLLLGRTTFDLPDSSPSVLVIDDDHLSLDAVEDGLGVNVVAR